MQSSVPLLTQTKELLFIRWPMCVPVVTQSCIPSSFFMFLVATGICIPEM